MVLISLESNTLEPLSCTAVHAVDPRTLISSAIPWRPDPSVRRVNAPSDCPPIVILPGFGNCSRDYEEPFAPAEDSIAVALRVTLFTAY